MRAVTVFAVLVLPVFADAAEKPKLEIELSAPKELYPDERVDVKVVIRNAGKEEVHILKAVDGALDGLRNMVDYKWKVTKGGQALPRRTDIVRIDNQVNTITAADLVAVPAGKVANPDVGSLEAYYNLNQPGKYTITLTYDFDPSGRDKTEGTELLKNLKSLPAAQAEGKVEITVLPFPPAVAAADDKMKAATARHQLITQFAEAVAKNPASTAAERDAAAERLKRATALMAEATEVYNAKMAEFRKQREVERKKK